MKRNEIEFKIMLALTAIMEAKSIKDFDRAVSAYNMLNIKLAHATGEKFIIDNIHTSDYSY